MITYKINTIKGLSSTDFRRIIKEINELESLPTKNRRSIRVDAILISRALEIAKSYGYTLTELVSIIHDRQERGVNANEILPSSREP